MDTTIKIDKAALLLDKIGDITIVSIICYAAYRIARLVLAANMLN